MNTYAATRSNFQSVPESSLKQGWSRLRIWLADYLEAKTRRQTETILAGLDRSVLEDIGVPHDHVSLRAGILDRYPRMITVRQPCFTSSPDPVGGRSSMVGPLQFQPQTKWR